MTTEPQIFAFRRLPGWVDDGSVRVSASAGRIVDVRVERSFLARSSDADYRQAEDALKDLVNRQATVNDEIAVLDAQKAQIEAIKAFSLDKITKDTTIGNISVQSYADVLTFISDSLRKTAKARREAQLEQEAIAPRLAASQRKLDEMKSLLSLEETTVSLNAARTLDMINSTGQPLLPGKVALYQDGAFIGMTDIDFIAESERFSLFLSVADHLKLSRTLDHKQSSLVHKMVNKMLVTFIVTAENLLEEETSLTLADRIPVSENKEIRVSSVKTTPAKAPDSQGILRWELKLKPKEKREFTISYQVEYPSELVIDARRRRAEQQEQPNQPSPSTALPKSLKQSDIKDQLMNLEEML